MRLFDTSTGHQRAKLTGDNGGVDKVTVAPDGTWLAICGPSEASADPASACSARIPRGWEAACKVAGGRFDSGPGLHTRL